jgi:hypothetical protein
LAAIMLAGCGTTSGSSSDASALLDQTFSGAHKVNSGTLSLTISLQPQGSSTLTAPLTLSFGGPFQSRGAGKLPQSNFNLNLSALGRSVSLGLLSTGTHGYVTFQGASYALPAAEFQKLESSFSSIASAPGSSGTSGILGKLGIQPLHWLNNPSVVGDETVGGADTTHIRAGINVAALLSDFNTFLTKASSLGIAGASSFPHGMSHTTINRVARDIQNPSVDVWTGNSDKTVRRLRINLTAPVHGQIASALGGLRALGIVLNMQYSDLNQPQTITAPSSVAPFSQLEAKLRALVSGIQSGVGGALGGSASGGGTGTSPSAGASASSSLDKYSQCINAAGNDVGKMQQCASLLSGK